MARRMILWSFAVLAVVAIAAYAAFEFTPWPKALLIRHAFSTEAAKVKAALAAHVPPGVAERLDVRYAGESDTLLDAFYPASADGTSTVLPTVVWVHGGAWISGTRKDVGEYLKIIAARGYAAVSVEYSIAPGAAYPTPLRQVNAALAWLREHGRELHVDASRIVLAGDSAGAQIVAQIANIVSVPSYAAAIGIQPSLPRRDLKGVLLNCGAYDITSVDLEGPFGDFLRTVMWSYSGTHDFMSDPRFATVSVVKYVTSDFPPAFISSGNGDPLTPQSKALAAKLTEAGATVDALFFPDDTTPPLPHEYQFNLDTDAGRLALDRMLAFLARVVPPTAG
ncbi:MAG TPA: alpha/beta hydrolase [Bauldia sp.]|nr:alpha/beta hydrolase [Bauldia sp.]